MRADVDLAVRNPKEPAKDVINEAQRAAQRLLSQAEDIGNGLISQCWLGARCSHSERYSAARGRYQQDYWTTR